MVKCSNIQLLTSSFRVYTRIECKAHPFFPKKSTFVSLALLEIPYASDGSNNRKFYCCITVWNVNGIITWI
ncbi:unnamed protein product [Rhizophagus irregularis]|nr:unnamed protein product [Rhizophagus irregularis]